MKPEPLTEDKMFDADPLSIRLSFDASDVLSAVRWLKDNAHRFISKCPHCSEEEHQGIEEGLDKAFPIAKKEVNKDGEEGNPRG